MDISTIQKDLRNIETHEAAQALVKLVSKWDGVELRFALESTANTLSIPFDIAQEGLRISIRSGTLQFTSNANSDETLLSVK